MYFLFYSICKHVKCSITTPFNACLLSFSFISLFLTKYLFSFRSCRTVHRKRRHHHSSSKFSGLQGSEGYIGAHLVAKRESREESEGRSYQYYGAGSRKPSFRGRRGGGSSLTHQRATAAAAAALSNANLTGKIQQMCHVLHQPQRPSTLKRQVIYLNVH